ncbi:MAG: hypothetical protein MUC34_04710 [Anaerolineae bacterium]|nr:hypothetical protein [Anaerolineae bacterium]
MAKAEIDAGICGFKTTCIATKNADGTIHLAVESGCKAVMKLAEQFENVEPIKEVFWRKSLPGIYQATPQCLSHPACPVPSGILKAIEVEAGFALPKDASIKVSKSNE